jgi:hypothetical protein
MTTMEKSRRGVRFILLCGAVLGLVALAVPALAASGNVLPPTARPKGYSLTEAAAATAVFNTGPRTPETLPTVFPFQILFLGPGETSPTFVVDPGTMFYVPVLFVDNAEPILGDFPDVNDPEAVSAYYFNPEQLGAEFIEVVVDGEVTSLGPAYVVGDVVP